MMKTIVGFLIVVTLSSCSDNEKKKVSRYYDLEGYFKEEANRLQSGNFNLEKKFVDGAYTETVTSISADWNRVLSPFMSCDINKASWVNSYDADSTVNGDTSRLVYRAKEEDLPIHKVEVLFYNSKPVKVFIEKGKENFYFFSFETYEYYPDHFFIQSMHKVRFTSEQRYEITGRFVR